MSIFQGRVFLSTTTWNTILVTRNFLNDYCIQIIRTVALLNISSYFCYSRHQNTRKHNLLAYSILEQ
uniref:Uncharacterized protein n=1 Tax=Rhizophagus irregularis (strain DAOM 181602 / DAOM 197198 / MUCL 43194) TaxID=747089 RepID=U9T733_RHIID